MDTTATPERHGDAAEPDLSSYRAAHAALRISTGRLVDVLRDLPLGERRQARALQRWYRGLRGELALHHQTEDTIFFPALAARVPTYRHHAATVNGDHASLEIAVETLSRRMDELVEVPRPQARTAALTAAAELHALLVEHLAFEEADVLPLFERHFGPDEYRALDQQALRHVPLRQALFTAPWFMATAPPDAAAQTWADASAALRLVHRLTRRRYDRLVATAFAAPQGTIGGRS